MRSSIHGTTNYIRHIIDGKSDDSKKEKSDKKEEKSDNTST